MSERPFYYRQSSGGDMIYILGVIGASVYYISTSSSILLVMVGVLKAIVWPAFLVYEVLAYLGKV